MKKMRILSVVAAVAGLFLLASTASAINLPLYMEFDLDNWTRLYRDGVPNPIDDPTTPDVDEAVPPAIGDMSRAFITFKDISPTVSGFPSVPDPGGNDDPPTWVAGSTDGTWLHGWEDNVVIQPNGIILQADASLNLYFTHLDDTSWEFEVYQTQVSSAEFEFGPNFLGAGPTAFDATQNNLATDPTSVDFLRGRFSESVYVDAFLNDPNGDFDNSDAIDIGFGPGLVNSLVAINIPGVLLGGEWVNQTTTPFSLGINAFVDIDPTWGVGAQFDQAFYGNGPNGDPYDLAIQNVRLNSEIGQPNADGEAWIISDDGVRGATVIPEPATMLLLGTGLVGLAGSARRRRKKNQA